MQFGLKSALVPFQHKDQGVEVETMQVLLAECIVEEPKVGAVEGRQVDQYLAEGNLVKGLVDVVRMVQEDGQGENEDAALTVDEEGPKEEEVRNAVWPHITRKRTSIRSTAGTRVLAGTDVTEHFEQHVKIKRAILYKAELRQTVLISGHRKAVSFYCIILDSHDISIVILN